MASILGNELMQQLEKIQLESIGQIKTKTVSFPVILSCDCTGCENSCDDTCDGYCDSGCQGSGDGDSCLVYFNSPSPV
jgi:hypothetical protein